MRRTMMKVTGDNIGFKLEVFITNYHRTLTINGRSGYTYNFVIDWGDNTIESYNTYMSTYSHYYTNPGRYVVEIKGMADVMFNNQSVVTKVLHWGGDAFEGFSAIDSLFYGCNHLNEIPNGRIKRRAGANVTSAYRAFSGCYLRNGIKSEMFYDFPNLRDFQETFAGSDFSSIPSDIFRYNTNANSFNGTFASNVSLTTLPSGLFEYNVKAVDFSNVFFECRKLSLRNDIFGLDYQNRFFNKSMVFLASFKVSSFTGTQGTAPELWNFNYGNRQVNKTSCFTGHSTESLSNYNSIPAEWR